MADTRCKLEEIRGTTGRAKTTLLPFNPWAARYNTWLLIKLTPKGVVFSFLFFSSKEAADVEPQRYFSPEVRFPTVQPGVEASTEHQPFGKL